MPYQWQSFARTADEWIICYYCLPLDGLLSVKLFSIGHALELYLKAAYTKMTGHTDAAMNLGHNVAKLMDACQGLDGAFMPDLRLRASVLGANILSYEQISALAQEDLFHFLHHQELYVIAKHLADLKYLGAPLKTVAGPYAFGFVFPNPEWATLFAAIRGHLKYPDMNAYDAIRDFVETGDVPAHSGHDLSTLLAAPRFPAQ